MSHTASESSSAIDELREDWLTAWVPDVAGNIDAALLLQGKPQTCKPTVRWLQVPKPQGEMNVPVLDPRSHAALHASVASLRDIVDATLSPSVFGYRRGADPVARYAVEWQKYFALAADLSANAAFVVLTDLENFFGAANWDRVTRTIEELTDDAANLRGIAGALRSAGLPHLPPGYGDARMLANVLLHAIDLTITVPFVRWVDDYTLFVPPSESPHEAIEALNRHLRLSGFRMNLTKTQILTRDEAVARHTNQLGDVYRPETDSHNAVQTALRKVFAMAVANPVAHRREVRFALARLQREHDDFAIDTALELLTTCPWEAPRLVSYLATFESDARVQRRVGELLTVAALRTDAWLVARLAPLVCRTGLAKPAANVLIESLPSFRHSPAWGLALRAIALRGEVRAVPKLIAQDSDNRAALVSLRDLDLAPPDYLVERQPELSEVLSLRSAPLPDVQSLL